MRVKLHACDSGAQFGSKELHCSALSEVAVDVVSHLGHEDATVCDHGLRIRSSQLSALSLKRNSSEVVCISTLAWRGTHSVQLHHLYVHIQFFFNSRVFIKE